MEKTTIKVRRRLYATDFGVCEDKWVFNTVAGYKAVIDDVPVVIHKPLRMFIIIWQVSDPETGLWIPCTGEDSTREKALASAKVTVYREMKRAKVNSFSELLKIAALDIPK